MLFDGAPTVAVVGRTKIVGDKRANTILALVRLQNESTSTARKCIILSTTMVDNIRFSALTSWLRKRITPFCLSISWMHQPLIPKPPISTHNIPKTASSLTLLWMALIVPFKLKKRVLFLSAKISRIKMYLSSQESNVTTLLGR